MSEPPGTTEEWLRFVSESGVQFPRLSFFLERRGVSIDDVFCPLAQHHCKELEELVFLDEYKISLSTPLSELMPRLQRLYLHSIPDAWNPSTEIPTMFPAFPHLTLLHFTSEIPWETIDIILPQCPQLQKLSVTLSSRLKEPASATHLNTSPNSHEHLTYLALSTDHGMVIIPDNFLHNWTFPNLRMLDYQLDDSETPPWVLSHPLISTVSRLILVRRDACGGYENEETLPAILRVAHSVEELGLACLDVGGDASVLKDTMKIITSIASSPSHSRLVKSLKRLHFMGLDDTPAVLNACQGQLQELCEAWSRHLDHLVLRFNDLSDTANDNGVEELFAEMKAGAKAGVSAEEIPMEVEILLFWEYIGLPLVPIGFQMWPLDFDRQTPLFKVLQEDGSWKERRGSAYHIA
ncbi:hypothetical protein BDN72DRAFT_849930 [Pluteus cervinus]|uniref:Uncharacterized protein n=1 Tax=Pluteus cervinus TaxID=181527 RepID=A0ACD3A6Y7_9AGAR|nr:hypothetical protein BDN72DRAFT_849930 [Pluteus cervinus]